MRRAPIALPALALALAGCMGSSPWVVAGGSDHVMVGTEHGEWDAARALAEDYCARHGGIARLAQVQEASSWSKLRTFLTYACDHTDAP